MERAVFVWRWLQGCGEHWLRALRDLTLGTICPACRLQAGGLCASCRAALRQSGPPLIHQVGTIDCISVGAYQGLLKSLLISHKEHRAVSLGRPLGTAVGDVIAHTYPGLAHGPPVLLVPMPSSRAAVRERGFDHCGRLAATAARQLRRRGIPARARRRLKRVKRVSDQAALGRRDRQLNQHGSMRWRGGAAVVILVDDIATTGATLSEAARAAAAGGSTVVLAATVAYTRRRSPDH